MTFLEGNFSAPLQTCKWQDVEDKCFTVWLAVYDNAIDAEIVTRKLHFASRDDIKERYIDADCFEYQVTFESRKSMQYF